MKQLITVTFAMVLFICGTAAGEDALTIIENGNVGIGTAVPTSKLEVNGDLTLNGNIKKGGSYADWYVGSYYSIPVDLRSASWEWESVNIKDSWSTVDFSSLLPQDAKRVRIFVDVLGTANNNELLLLNCRPLGAACYTMRQSYVKNRSEWASQGWCRDKG
ncbi:MAG: hypothetical protein V6Z89_09950 [Desulfobacter sp.]